MPCLALPKAIEVEAKEREAKREREKKKKNRDAQSKESRRVYATGQFPTCVLPHSPGGGHRCHCNPTVRLHL